MQHVDGKTNTVTEMKIIIMLMIIMINGNKKFDDNEP